MAHSTEGDKDSPASCMAWRRSRLAPSASNASLEDGRASTHRGGGYLKQGSKPLDLVTLG